MKQALSEKAVLERKGNELKEKALRNKVVRSRKSSGNDGRTSVNP